MNAPGLLALVDDPHPLDLQGLRGAFLRLDREAGDNPARAATDAAELLRAVMRAVLAEHGVEHGPGDGLDTLAAKALPALGQLSNSVPDAMRGAAHSARC